MTQNKRMHRNILTRSLAVIVLSCMYAFSMLGTSALMLSASSTAAEARGGGGGGGGNGGGGGGGHAFGRGGVSRVVVFAAVVSAAADSALAFIPATTMAFTLITRTRAVAIWFASASRRAMAGGYAAAR